MGINNRNVARNKSINIQRNAYGSSIQGALVGRTLSPGGRSQLIPLQTKSQYATLHGDQNIDKILLLA